MQIEFRLPDLGEGLTEGELVEWLVRPGEQISLDQPLAIVATDKTTVEIPAPVAGRVKDLCVDEGKVVPVQTLLLTIEQGQHERLLHTPGDEMPSEQDRPEQITLHVPHTEQGTPDKRPPSRILATPAMRRRMRDLALNPASIQGHGEGGRILDADLLAYRLQHEALPSAPSLEDAPSTQAFQAREDKQIERFPLRGIRRHIAENIEHSLKHIPQGTLFFEADVTTLVQFKEQGRFARQEVKLSYLPFLVKAAVLALQAHPSMNASLDTQTQEILLKRVYHIGIATATPNGLLVPVLHHAERMPLLEIARQISLISEKRAEGSFQRSELTGSTFTISNYGSLGGTFSTPIINPGEGAILGMGRITKRPRVVEDQLVIRHILPLSLTVDHRILDGNDGLQFLNTLSSILGNPSLLVQERE